MSLQSGASIASLDGARGLLGTPQDGAGDPQGAKRFRGAPSTAMPQRTTAAAAGPSAFPGPTTAQRLARVVAVIDTAFATVTRAAVQPQPPPPAPAPALPHAPATAGTEGTSRAAAAPRPARTEPASTHQQRRRQQQQVAVPVLDLTGLLSSSEGDSDDNDVQIVGVRLPTGRRQHTRCGAVAALVPVVDLLNDDDDGDVPLPSPSAAGCARKRRHVLSSRQKEPSPAQLPAQAAVAAVAGVGGAGPVLPPPAWPSTPVLPEPPSPEQGGFKCSICMERVDDTSCTVCGHAFCTPCVTEWVQKQKKCPTCRKALRPNQVHKIFLNLQG